LLKSKAEKLFEELSALLALKCIIKIDSNLRCDYKQRAELELAVLGYIGYTSPELDSHHSSGATHSARWMTQVLNCLKMLMWANQLSYDIEIMSEFHQFDMFLVLLYIPA